MKIKGQDQRGGDVCLEMILMVEEIAEVLCHDPDLWEMVESIARSHGIELDVVEDDDEEEDGDESSEPTMAH